MAGIGSEKGRAWQKGQNARATKNERGINPRFVYFGVKNRAGLHNGGRFLVARRERSATEHDRGNEKGITADPMI